MTVMRLPILWTTLIVISTRMYFTEQSLSEESQPIIENKNINIIVNVNAREVAEELWKIIDARLNNKTTKRTNQSVNSKNIINELEEVIAPLISPTRRDSLPSANQVATELDNITRMALIMENPTMNVLDKEIMTRDIVADMMESLKIVLSKKTELKIDKNLNKRMLHTDEPTIQSNNNE